jgi:FkbM family methyltransferase
MLAPNKNKLSSVVALVLFLKDFFRKTFGIDIHKTKKGYQYNPSINFLFSQLRKKVIENTKTDLIIDGGANEGQYGSDLIHEGININNINIWSFEPLSKPFKKLELKSKEYKGWKVFQYALGDKIEKAEINISNNDVSSSILQMTEGHTFFSPNTYNTGQKELIEVRTLNSIEAELASYKNIFLKIDVQGFEENVLKGASNILSKVVAIEIELSLQETYTGQWLIEEALTSLRQRGFLLLSFEPVMWIDSGAMGHVNALLVKKGLLSKLKLSSNVTPYKA